MLLVVIGLYLLVDNYKIQDILVELIGTRTALLTTGVVQSALSAPLALCASLLVLRTASLRLTRTVFVPSDVYLIKLCNLNLVITLTECEGFLMSVEYLSKYGRI